MIGRQIFESEIAAHMDPFDLESVALAGDHLQAGEGRPGQPVLPVVVSHKHPVQPHLDVAGGIKPELKLPALRSLDLAGVAHAGYILLETVRKGVVDIDEFMLDARFGA